MNILSPSILAADFSKLAAEIKPAVDGGARYIHIDCMDGIFVPNISIGIPVMYSLRPCFNEVFDLHLMIVQPERYIEAFIDAGADILTFHVESTDKADRIIEKVHEKGKKVGITLKPATPVSALEPYLAAVDMALVMTVEPGFGGQKFMPDMLEKIHYLKDYKQKNRLDFDIEVDGGVILENLDDVLNAGANVIVAGSSIFSGEQTFDNTRKFIKKML